MSRECRESTQGEIIDDYLTYQSSTEHSLGETMRGEITASIITSPVLSDSYRNSNEDIAAEGQTERIQRKDRTEERSESTKFIDERRLHLVTNNSLAVNVSKQKSNSLAVDNEPDKSESDESSFESTDDDDEGDQLVGNERADIRHDDEESEFPQLSVDDVMQKLNDVDVIGDYVHMKDIQSIGLEDLEKLEKLNRSIPVIKRLLTNTRLTSRDVKSTSIDKDIKSIVSEFLKTNMVGNFIISRVLRENYATFYGWLATHMQSERNAWLVRLKQTLERYESLRRDNIENYDVIIESANKLERLLHSCSQSIGSPTKASHVGSDMMNSKNLTLLQPLPIILNGQTLQGNNENTVTMNHHKKFLQKIKQSTRSTQSNVSAINNSYEVRSDPLTSRNKKNVYCGELETRDEGKENNKRGKLGYSSEKHLNQSGLSKDDKIYDSLKNTALSQLNGSTDSVDAKLPRLDNENTEDWKNILLNRIQQLEGMCEFLVYEREECLRYVGIKSSDNLYEAISTFLHKRSLSGQGKRKEIEQRLCVLEIENKQLIEEMTSLQNMLRDKQQDALSLQKQLDKLEEMLTSATCAKVNRCVGTDDSELGVNKGVKKQRNQLPEADKTNQVPYRYKMISMRSPAQDRLKEIEKNNLSNGLREKQTKDTQQRNFQALKQEISQNQKVNDTHFVASNMKNESKQYGREKSIIEISEEKLNILKLRAQKLEDSLHEAISSMNTLRKEKSDGESSSTKSDSKLQNTSLTNKRHERNHYVGASLQVQRSTPRLAVIRRPRSQHRSRSETLLESEPTSFLTGRSVALNASTPADRSMAQSCLTVMVDKHRSDAQSKPVYDNLIANKYSNGMSAEECHSQPNISNTDTSKVAKVKVISRHKVASNAMVSKCLRCQKLFCAVDNHKLACFYHTKEKERIEHYDQTGKLIRVALVWMCCHQPQEIEGCCYGQHV
ncbi:hypothetical protein Btru_024056 [Bulinus truncatus]|nr:hypothetical protein Btru_024056 [Bulinus truncatus]